MAVRTGETLVETMGKKAAIGGIVGGTIGALVLGLLLGWLVSAFIAKKKTKVSFSCLSRRGRADECRRHENKK